MSKLTGSCNVALDEHMTDVVIYHPYPSLNE